MIRPIQRPAARLAAGAALLALTALAGCGSPAARFYTLSADRASAPAIPANPPFLIQLTGVDVPEQVANPQFVIQKSATQVDILEQERWSAPPSDEIHHALSLALARQLDTIDIGSSASYATGTPVYRISTVVSRFESWPGQRAVLEATWSVRALGGRAVMTCHTLASEPVAAGYDALVDGHRRALEALAAQIAAGVRTLAAQSPQDGAAARCPQSDAPAAAQ